MINKKYKEAYDLLINIAKDLRVQELKNYKYNNDLKKLKNTNELLLNEIQRSFNDNEKLKNELNSYKKSDEETDILKFKKIIYKKYNAVHYADKITLGGRAVITINIRQYQISVIVDVNKVLNDNSKVDYDKKYEKLDQIFYLLEKKEKYKDIIKSHKDELLSIRNNINNKKIKTTDEDIEEFIEKQKEYIKYEEEKNKEISDTYKLISDWVNN